MRPSKRVRRKRFENDIGRDVTINVVIPTALLSTDRIMQRWNVSIGSGLPTDFWDDAPAARLTPLDDDAATVVDQLVLHAPHNKRRILVMWYRTPEPPEAIASRLRIRPDTIKNRLIVALCYMSLKFKDSRQPTLAGLLRIRS